MDEKNLEIYSYIILYTHYNYLYTVPIVCSRVTCGFRHLDLTPTLDLSPSKNTLQPWTARPPRRKPFKNSNQLNLKQTFQKVKYAKLTNIYFSIRLQYYPRGIHEEYHLEPNWKTSVGTCWIGAYHSGLHFVAWSRNSCASCRWEETVKTRHSGMEMYSTIYTVTFV